MVVQAFKLNLPRSPLTSPIVSSVQFEPHSQSLALMHPDSSFSLYPAVSPLSVPPPPPPLPTYIPAPSSSSSFLLLRSKNSKSNGNPCVVFIVAGPHNGGVTVLLRFWVLRNSQVFGRPRVLCTQKYLAYHEKSGVIMDVSHGVSLSLSGSVNYFVMHLDTKSKIWVFALKAAEGNDNDGMLFQLMKCAVINCESPIWSISTSFCFLVLGEENGIRALPLHSLIKKKAKKHEVKSKDLKHVKVIEKGGQRPNLLNGMIKEDGCVGHGRVKEISKVIPSKISKERVDHCSISVMLKPEKHMTDLQTACFLAFDMELDGSSKSEVPMKPVRGVSIQSFSGNKFLVLDSSGYLHLLRISNITNGSRSSYDMKRLGSVNMQKVTILPDTSSDTQTIWTCDGMHSVHRIVLAETRTSVSEKVDMGNNETLLQFSVEQAIFTSEIIQDIVALAANAVLILGQGEMIAYVIS